LKCYGWAGIFSIRPDPPDFDPLEPLIRIERARLAEALLESLQQEGPADIEAARENEIEALVAAHPHGEKELMDCESVLAELRRRTL